MTTGSGLIVAVTVNGCPIHPLELTGITVYTTSIGAAVSFVQASLAISLAVKPFPIIGLPADAVKPF